MKFQLAACLALIASCRQEDRQPAHEAIIALRAIPTSNGVETTKGGNVELGVQALDAAEDGVDGATILFLLGSGELAFPDHADQRSVRITTALGTLDGVSANGLATVSVKAPDMVAQEIKLPVYGTLVDDIGADTDADRFDVIEFTITVKP